MNTIPVSEGLVNFQFPRQEGFDYGFNIYALQDENRVLLIDAAFRSQIRKVKKYLNQCGAGITHIVATHFHSDHISGLLALPQDIRVLGSGEYSRTLGKEIPQRVVPVSFPDEFRFGDHTLRFFPAPGHSPCSILVLIDNTYLHTGDQLMGRYDGKRILPWVEKQHIDDHIKSLVKVRETAVDVLLLSHGPQLEGRDVICQEVQMRLHYLNAVKSSGEKLSLEEALPDSPEGWVCKDFFYQLIEASSEKK